MVFDLLTEKDKELINSYRRNYANVYDRGEAASIEKVLSPWNNAKSEYLETLFGDQLIITKPIEFKEGIDDLEERMRELMGCDMRIRSFQQEIMDIYRSRSVDTSWNHPYSRQTNFVSHLFDTYVLAENKVYEGNFDYNSNTFDLDIGNTTLKVQKGMKPMRIIAKIANEYKIGITPDEDGVSDLEHFRRVHSLGLNQKLLKGDLCLSIHPLDYMTMSDNNEGWDSCMSWENDGEYKQGTVEMMNSPSVVVAYLSSGPENYSWGWGDNVGYWNSKKWRSLFIVDREFIINVRSYPYQNDNLVKAVIRELSKLSGWGDQEPLDYLYLNDYENYRKQRKPMLANGRKVAIDFSTGAMYNDFGHYHYIAVNPNNTEPIIRDYYYSGLSECMFCGSTDSGYIGYDYSTGALTCGRCNPSFWCECCDDRVEGTEHYETADGYTICSYCWDECTIQDITDEKIYLRCNSLEIHLSTNKTTWSRAGGAFSEYVYDDNIGTDAWYKLFKIDEPRRFEKSWNTIHYVLVDDLTEEGLDAFGLSNNEELEDYFNEIILV